MTPPAPVAQPTLTDGVVTLRPWRGDDAAAVAAACQDPEIARFVPIPQPYALPDGIAFVEGAATESATGPSAHFAIVDPATDRLLGAISRHGPEPTRPHRAMVGYWLASEARGRGLMTRAVQLVVDWTLRTTSVVRLELYTDVANERSRAVALRAGFEFEGIRRAWDLDRDGRPIDAAFYVIVRSPTAAAGRGPGG